MRTLKRNQVQLWIVTPMGEQDVVDEDGYFTGEVQLQYTTPRKISLPLYPASGDIKDRVFGTDVDINMVSVSNIELKENDLIFYDEPIGDYDVTYDYSISIILPSLNVFNYGLKRRM